MPRLVPHRSPRRRRQMFSPAAVVGLSFAMMTGALAAAGDEPASSERKSEQLDRRIERLVRQLGNDEFTARESAQKELLQIGVPALDALRMATRDPSAEVSSRARFILQTIEDEINRPSLVVRNVDGTNPRRIIVRERRHFGSPDWSPTGRQIAFDAWSAAPNNYLTAHVYVSNLDGSEAKDLGDGAMPSWSPDGKRLAFHRYGGERGIWIMNADGTAARRVQPSGISPRWSPDGRRIAFVGRGIGFSSGGILIYDLEKGDVKQFISAGLQRINIGLSWSPDGKRLAFTGHPPDAKPGETALATVSVESREVTVLHTGRMATHTAWSPDGKQIAFNIRVRIEKPPRAQVYVVASDGKSQPRPLKGQDGDRMNLGSAWSPDGKTLIYATRPAPKPAR